MALSEIGRYEVIRELGRGGMAVVYLARDPQVDREVAIKLLPAHFAQDPQFLARFRREARIIASLEHPHIVPIYDFGEVDGRPYIVMRNMSGGSLADRLKDGPMETAEAARILEQIASALDVAHARGIVHRDLKPANILFDDRGNAYLADFGIVKLGPGQSLSLTSSGGVIGTPAYMSPEQALGDGPLDGRSDVYSLGIILYQMLTGQTPYQSDTPISLAMMHVLQPVPQISTVRPDLPVAYQALLDRALTKKAEDRFPTAGMLSHTLMNVLRQPPPRPARSEPTFVVPPPKPPPAMVVDSAESTPPPPRRRARWAWLIGLLALLVIGGATAVALGRAGIIDLAQFGIGGSSTAVAVVTETSMPTDVPSATPAPTDTASATPTPAATATPAPPATDADVQDTVATAVAATLAASLPSATATPSRTAAPSRTASPTPSTTPSATATPTPSRTPQPSLAGTGGGLPLTFESFGSWGIGDEQNGTFTRSNEQAHAGTYSGKLAYQFETPDNDYVVFLQTNPISGTPNALKLWVYGDGSGHFLNAWIIDNAGETWQVPFGQVFHSGWAQMTGLIDTEQNWPWTTISGPSNDKVDYPIAFRAFVLDDYSASYEGSGEIFLDDLTATTVSGGTSPVVAVPTRTPSTGTTPAAGTATPAPDVGEIGRIIYTSGNTLLTTDPAASAPTELGTLASNSCASPATTVGGLSVDLYYGFACSTGESIHTCTSPNGQYQVLVDGRNLTNVITVRPTDSEPLYSVYTGNYDRVNGIRWSPLSNSFMFSVNDAIYLGFPNQTGYTQILTLGKNAIFSPDGALILYRKPVGPGVHDVFVANADGSNPRNVTNVATIDKVCAAWRR